MRTIQPSILRSAAARPGRWAWPALVAALLVPGAPTPAADDIPLDPAKELAPGQQPRIYELQTAFEQQVFALLRQFVIQFSPAPQPAGSGPGSPARIMASLRPAAERRVAELDRTCRFSEQQRQILGLAVESDLRRAERDLLAGLDGYAGIRVNLNEPAGREKLQHVNQAAQQCRQRLVSLLGPEALVIKALPETIDERQLAAYHDAADRRRSSVWRGSVAMAMARLEETLGLDQRQSAALEAVLLENTPPLRIESTLLANLRHFGTPDAAVLMAGMVLGELPDEQLAALVSPRQWKTLANLVRDGRAQRAGFLAQGILEESKP